MEALLPATNRDPGPGTQLIELSIDQISPNRYQPRQSIDPSGLAELTDSIRVHGLMEPVLVRRIDGDRYELIAGERRWRSAALAGLSHVPALVRQASDSELLELALVENLLRKDLNPMETARAYERLIQVFHLTQEQVARQLGTDRSSVANSLRLLQLPKPVQENLVSEKISMGHAKALLSLSNQEDQIRLGHQVVRQGLSVRQTEGLVKQMTRGKGRRRSVVLSPELMQIQEQLGFRLGTKVRLTGRSDRGQLVIDYYNTSDLEKVLEIILH